MDYYSSRLSSDLLLKCYETAPPRIKKYLAAEIDFVLQKVKASDMLLELGCGYGRVMKRLLGTVDDVTGIDTSLKSLELAKIYLGGMPLYHLYVMNAIALGFKDNQFDVVICIQNSISAFRVDLFDLFKEAIRITREGGIVLFSSYAEKFWEERLNWFQMQSKLGLIGEIDDDATGNGTIVCRDGFKATTVMKKDFLRLAAQLKVQARTAEVDHSSLFCVIKK